MPRLQAQARSLGLELPDAFVRFVTAPTIYQRVPSITGCFLEFSSGIIRGPAGGGMLRFLNDSQGCVAWYLYMVPGGDYCVVTSGEWLDGSPDDPAIDASQYFWCGASLEHFLYRFWLEDEIWQHVTRKQPLSKVEQEYLAAAIANRHLLPPDP